MRVPRPREGKPRAAFTLVELLAVIAIIGLLAALLLPAVQAARESARRSTCSNNLAQLGKAAAAYEAANGHFPPGAIGASAYSWIVAILPQLEQQPTYDKLPGLSNKTLLWTKDLQDDAHAAVAGFYSPMLICPTNPMPVKSPTYPQHIASSYIAVAGASDSAFMTVTPSADRCAPGAASSGNCYNGLMASPWRDGSTTLPGTLYYYQQFPDEATVTGCRPAQVRDGLSNCLLLGEQSDWGWLTFAGNPPVQGYCQASHKGWLVGKFQPKDTGGNRAYNLTAVNKPLGSRFCDLPGKNTDGTTRLTWDGKPYSGLDNQIGFFSAHGPGAMFVFGDSAVRWLDESIDFNLYQRLAIRDTRRGGPTLPDGSANAKTLP